jgi:hypothetical protein
MDTKPYLAQVRRAYRKYQRRVGTTVTWYEYDTAHSAPGDIYDESPTSRWKNGFELPVLAVIRDEDVEAPREEGLYTGGHAHLSFGTDQAACAGMTDPHNSRLHLVDRFYWDGEYWGVTRFQVSGRLIRFEVIIGVDAQRVAIEELVNQQEFPPTPGH